MILTWYGHSCVHIVTSDGVKIIVDPFINGNPTCPVSVDDIDVDYIILTHGHNDHVGDTVEISKRCHAPVIGMVELCDFLEETFQLETIGANIGGKLVGNFGSVKFTQAIHSSSYVHEGKAYYMGLAAGIILDDGATKVYHAGDTAFFGDMAHIGPVDLAFLPIGDKYTMGIEEALKASELIQADTFIPVHYNTFSALKQNPYHYINQLPEANGFVPEIGRPFNESCIYL
ncbi:hypothetical protein AOC36_10770 [Erysipelothrix larvae]|uniref:UPF0173 metal-dependent hydrolase AOC36_10770 n=1 Tax=Erysipelothrix larvae TaxID=1514105 RepID=A0A0X8H1P3_9FIRM|nr:metal-dependent hydrolase [Erysipelothrix larvae]AMC94436.1 hypothetical protein AOC36_10770 [Erysipelothrix larvae]